VAAITIRNLDDELKHRLQLRAASHGRSMEAEVREILVHAVDAPGAPRTLVDAIRERFSELGGVELELPARSERARAAEF
jgi:plasmid stability protein